MSRKNLKKMGNYIQLYTKPKENQTKTTNILTSRL